METFEYLAEFIGGSFLLIGFGWIIGSLFKLNKFSDNLENSRDPQLRREDVETEETWNLKQNAESRNA